MKTNWLLVKAWVRIVSALATRNREATDNAFKDWDMFRYWKRGGKRA